MLTRWNLLCQKLQRLLVVETVSRRLQRVWESKLWKNNWVKGAGKGLQAESFQQSLQNKSVCREESFLQTFLVDLVKKFWVPNFWGSVCKSWRESPSSWRCLVVPWTRNLSFYFTPWKLHSVWISNGSELLRWFETDVLGLETETCQGSQLRNLQNQRKKEHKEDAKAEEEETADEEPVPLVTHVNNILHSIFSNVEVYINNQQIYSSNRLYAYISNNFKGTISEYKGLALLGVLLWRSSGWNYGSAFVWTFFQKENENA